MMLILIWSEYRKIKKIEIAEFKDSVKWHWVEHITSKICFFLK